MAHFAWKQEYSVGDGTIDAQHQELIRLMNDLYELLQQDGEPQEGQIMFLFDGLAQYIVNHFTYEEQRMADGGYLGADLAAHHEEHQRIVRMVRQYNAQVSEGQTGALKELLPFLCNDWLIHHICESDQAYAPYLQPAK